MIAASTSYLDNRYDRMSRLYARCVSCFWIACEQFEICAIVRTSSTKVKSHKVNQPTISGSSGTSSVLGRFCLAFGVDDFSVSDPEPDVCEQFHSQYVQCMI